MMVLIPMFADWINNLNDLFPPNIFSASALYTTYQIVICGMNITLHFTRPPRTFMFQHHNNIAIYIRSRWIQTMLGRDRHVTLCLGKKINCYSTFGWFKTLNTNSEKFHMVYKCWTALACLKSCGDGSKPYPPSVHIKIAGIYGCSSP